MSKYRPKVVHETKLNKDAMRTMGPAKLEPPSPDQYLKKHSNEPKFLESEFTCRFFGLCECVLIIYHCDSIIYVHLHFFFLSD